MWLLWVLLVSLLSASSVFADSKAVTTTLTTKWADTPLLLEARYSTKLLNCSSLLAALHLTLHFWRRQKINLFPEGCWGCYWYSPVIGRPGLKSCLDKLLPQWDVLEQETEFIKVSGLPNCNWLCALTTSEVSRMVPSLQRMTFVHFN